MDDINQKIDNLIKKGGIMSKKEYKLIYDYINSIQPCNLLVFGLGNDSYFLNEINSGYSLFLENIEDWYKKFKDSGLNIKMIDYNIPRDQWKNKLNEFKKNGICDDLLINGHSDLSEINWDVIIVDGPYGKGYGRHQSLYTSWKLKKEHTYVIVHDVDRDIENQYCNNVILNNSKEIDKIDRLKIFK